MLRAEIDAVYWRGDGKPPPALPIRFAAVEATGPVGKRGAASLCAEDRDEREVAAASIRQLCDWALGVGGTTLVVRLPAPRRLEPLWQEVRDHFLRGTLDPVQRIELLAQRAVLLQPSLDRTRAALDKILDHAERAGCRVVLTNRARYLDLPSPDEAELLLQEFEGAPLQLWFDGPAAHLPDAMELVPVAWSKRIFDRKDSDGCFVGDACGPIRALAPGRGALGATLRDWIGVGGTRVFVPWDGLSFDEALAAYHQTARWLGELSS